LSRPGEGPPESTAAFLLEAGAAALENLAQVNGGESAPRCSCRELGCPFRNLEYALGERPLRPIVPVVVKAEIKSLARWLKFGL